MVIGRDPSNVVVKLKICQNTFLENLYSTRERFPLYGMSIHALREECTHSLIVMCNLYHTGIERLEVLSLLSFSSGE